MKTAHILNIGYPKCGTSWLWNTLVQNNSISDHEVKENFSLLKGAEVEQYQKQYIQDITANFCTLNFALDRYIIQQLAAIPEIKVSIILRDHVSLLWSFYEFSKITKIDFQSWCYQMYDTRWFVKTDQIIQRWREHFEERVKVFWFDDLKQDNRIFYFDYCHQMGIDPGVGNMLPKENVTRYRSTMPSLDQDLLDLLQLETSKLNLYK